MWIIVAPLIAVQFAHNGFGIFTFLGTLVWLIGFIFKAGGDWQLAHFKANSTNKGSLLKSGLWD